LSSRDSGQSREPTPPLITKQEIRTAILSPLPVTPAV
jgi:hypothetical protein